MFAAISSENKFNSDLTTVNWPEERREKELIHKNSHKDSGAFWPFQNLRVH